MKCPECGALVFTSRHTDSIRCDDCGFEGAGPHVDHGNDLDDLPPWDTDSDDIPEASATTPEGAFL